MDNSGGTVQNNSPVGSAGQPFGRNNTLKEMPEGKSSAIKRRLAKKKTETGKK